MNTKADKGKLKEGLYGGPAGALNKRLGVAPTLEGGKGAQRIGVTVEHLKGERII